MVESYWPSVRRRFVVIASVVVRESEVIEFFLSNCYFGWCICFSGSRLATLNRLSSFGEKAIHPKTDCDYAKYSDNGALPHEKACTLFLRSNAHRLLSSPPK
jgi:hypothetical protein